METGMVQQQGEQGEMEMEDVEEFCESVLSRFTEPQHDHLCSVIGDISQGLRDLNHPLAYLAASLDRLLASDPSPPPHHLEALLTIISMLLPGVSPAALRKESDYLSDLLTRLVLSPAATDTLLPPAFNCLSHLLVAAHPTTSWSHLSALFGLLLQFIADSRPKVRRQAHVSLRDVMQRFRETPLLPPASEAIATTFDRFLLPAGGSSNKNTNSNSNSNSNSNANAKEVSRAQEVLYVLDCLKDTLPLMSLKFSTKILNYFNSLLALHQSAATRRITDALYLLCLQPTADVSPEALVELLCSLATSVSSNNMSGDNLTFTARLLDAGMKKVFSLNRQTCVVKLPVVFSAFKDILASEHEEPLSVAMEALKSLIHTCIDETLIKQGVDQITSSGSVRKSAPTIIEKLCATVESLLDYSFAAVWDMSFQVVAAMFDKLGDFSSYFLKGTLKNLEDIQKLPDEDFIYRKQLHDCMGVAVVALGPETFLKFLPLNVEAQDPFDANVWLFPILKQNIVGARLSFFNESLLDSIRVLKLKSAKYEQEGCIHSARSVDGLVYSLWSLLPSFCNYPVDTAESFKDLEAELCHSLREETEFRGVICSGLQTLVQQNKRIMEGENEPSGKCSTSQQRAVSFYTSEVAACNLDVLRSSAREILSTLSGIFMKSSKDDGGSLQKTIGEFASIADKSVVSGLFKSTMQKLLNVTKEVGKLQNTKGSSSMEIDNSSDENSLPLTRAKLYDLAVAFLPGLGTEEVDLLFLAVEPALKFAMEDVVMDPETAFLASKEETGNEWELFKENVRPLKRGRDIKLLNNSLISNSHFQLRDSLLQTRRKLLKAIDEYEGEDPLQPWLHCIKWVQDAFPPGGDCSGLVVIFEQCVRAFWHDDRYKNDLRYLKVWLEYAENCDDAQVIFSFLDTNKIGHTHSLFYIAYANHLELKNKIKTANEIYECGISRNAQPIEKLKSAYKKFFARSMSRPKPNEEELMETQQPMRSFGTILARGDNGNRTQESSFDIARKRQKQEGAQGGSLKVFKETGRNALHGSESSMKPSTWHTLGARTERNKENNAIPSKWTSNKIPQRAFGRAAHPPTPCIEVFVDEEECSKSHSVSNGGGRVQLRDNDDGKDLKKETELLRENPLRHFPPSSLR